jgi:glycosyltransferase involved in cell wall biosynthesis
MSDDAAARRPRPPRRFTVLLPVVRPPQLLPFAVRSVLAQTEPDFELCIIGDGAPPETIAAARRFAAQDPRVQVFAFPKGARHGEAHRAAVLQGSQAWAVAHIGDDDLWLPDHLARLGPLLDRADLGTVPGFSIRPDLRLKPEPFGDLALPMFRQAMLDRRWNFFGPTEAAYRLAAYRSLPEGWAPGPEGVWSDLNMWRKFLCHPGLRFASGTGISTLKFPAKFWADGTLEDRQRINAAVWDQIQRPEVLDDLRQAAALLRVQSIKARQWPALLRADPVRYLPLAGRWLFGPRPRGPWRVPDAAPPDAERRRAGG